MNYNTKYVYGIQNICNTQFMYTNVYIATHIYIHICVLQIHIFNIIYYFKYSYKYTTIYIIIHIQIVFLNLILLFDQLYNICFTRYVLYSILHQIHVCFISISPDNVCSTSPLSALQILTVSSQDPDTTLLPSAEKATDKTSLAWPDKRYMSKKTNILSTYASYIYLQT